MEYEWQTVEQAAVTLGFSTRTINRRIKDGLIESRMNAQRREVLVCLSEEDPQPDASSTVAEPGAAAPLDVGSRASPAATSFESNSNDRGGYDLAMAGPDPSVEGALALADEKVHRAELAIVAFRQTANLCQAEISRARMGSRIAWGAVAMMSLGMYVAVGWSTSQITQSRAQSHYLAEQLKTLSETTARDRLRAEEWVIQAGQSEQAKARAEGELSAVKSAMLERAAPPTPPTPTLLQRLASLASP